MKQPKLFNAGQRANTMSDDNDNDNDSSKLTDLKSRIRHFNSEHEEKSEKMEHSSADGSNMAVAFRACSELIVSIGVCGAAGYYFDQYFETKPAGLIIGLLTGMCVGFLGIYRITNNMGMAVGYKNLPDNAKNHDKDEEKDPSKK